MLANWRRIQWNSHGRKKEEKYHLRPYGVFMWIKKWFMKNIHLCKYCLLLEHSINFIIVWIFHTQSELMVLTCTCASLLFLILKLGNVVQIFFECNEKRVSGHQYCWQLQIYKSRIIRIKFFFLFSINQLIHGICLSF